MIFETAHFGPVTTDEASTIRFPAGLPGFEGCRLFTILRHPEQPALMFLQSLDRPELCFLAVPATVLRHDYQPAISEEDREMLGFTEGHTPDPAALMALALVSLDEDAPPTANLRAPVVVNLGARRAVQAIRPDGDYSCREPLALEEAVC